MVDERESTHFQDLVGKLQDRVELTGDVYEPNITDRGLHALTEVHDRNEPENFKGLTVSEDISLDKVGVRTSAFKIIATKLKDVREKREEWKWR